MSKREGNVYIMDRAAGVSLDRSSGLFPGAMLPASDKDLEVASRVLADAGVRQLCYASGAVVPAEVRKAAAVRVLPAAPGEVSEVSAVA